MGLKYRQGLNVYKVADQDSPCWPNYSLDVLYIYLYIKGRNGCSVIRNVGTGQIPNVERQEAGG